MAANKKSPISEKASGAKTQAAGLRRAGDFYSGKGVRGGERAQAAAGAKRIAATKKAVSSTSMPSAARSTSKSATYKPVSGRTAANTKGQSGGTRIKPTSVSSGSKSKSKSNVGSNIAKTAGTIGAIGAAGAIGKAVGSALGKSSYVPATVYGANGGAVITLGRSLGGGLKDAMM